MGSIDGSVTYGAGYEDQEGSSTGDRAERVQEAASNAVDSAQEAVSSATEAVAQTAVAAVDTAQGAAATVVDTAQEVVSTAAGAVAQTAGAVVDTAQQATSAVTGAVSTKVDQAADAAASGVERVADTVAQTVYSGDASPGTRRVAETAVSALDRTAEYLREGDLSLVVEDLRGVVRRHPLRSLILGLGLGYLARGAFFPSSGAQARPSSPPLLPPPPRPVPVYSAAGYDASSGIGYDAAPSVGLGVSAGLSGATTFDTLDTGLGATGIDTLDTGLGDTAFAGSMGAGTLAGDDLLAGDALGSADNAIDFPTGSALDTDAGLGLGADTTDVGFGLGTTDAGFGADTGSLGLTSDASGSGLSSGAGDLGLGDTTTGQSDISTMPSEDQLRQWDAGTSGQSS